jgi:hypothetical protein
MRRVAEQESMNPFPRNRVLKSVEDVKRLASRLAECPNVNRFDEGEHNEAWALADTFADIESEFREFLDELLPKLAKAEGEELTGLLFEIGVGFQHVLHHIIENQKFYKYLVPEGTSVFEEPDKAGGPGVS